jgi:hypothetical protein
MRRHLNSTTGFNPDRRRSTTAHEDLSNQPGYSIIFRELFCVAAAALAERMHIPVQNLGILYDTIMATGKDSTEPKRYWNLLPLRRMCLEDVEPGQTGGIIYGRGQVLFVVRQVNESEAIRLTSAGFRFANVNHVGGIIARSMQITLQELTAAVSRLHYYCRKPSKLVKDATYLACFAVRAPVRAIRTSVPKWEILVPKDLSSELPAVELSPVPLKTWQMEHLRRFDGKSVNQCLHNLNQMREYASDEHEVFLQRIQSAILALVETVPEPFFSSALFCAKPFKVPCQEADGAVGQATIMCFCIIPDVHTITLRSDRLRYIPLSFFKVRQRLHRNAPDHGVLTRAIHQEFGSFLFRSDMAASCAVVRNLDRPRAARLRSMVTAMLSRRLSARKGVRSGRDSDSEGDIYETNSQIGVRSAASHPFGGIMVSSDITVDAKTDETEAHRDLGTRAEVQVAVTEQPTYVDELFHEARSRWQKM